MALMKSVVIYIILVNVAAGMLMEVLHPTRTIELKGILYCAYEPITMGNVTIRLYDDYLGTFNIFNSIHYQIS